MVPVLRLYKKGRAQFIPATGCPPDITAHHINMVLCAVEVQQGWAGRIAWQHGWLGQKQYLTHFKFFPVLMECGILPLSSQFHV